MIEALFNQPNMVAVKRLLDVTAMRHEAIASNLANVDTPGYRRLDVSPAFERQLQNAIAARDTAAMRRVEPAVTLDSRATARRRDGNSVDLETELVHLNRNSLQHAAESQFLTGSLLRLRTAITGRTG